MNVEILLTAAAFGTSVISATLGVAGGILLLSLMTPFFAPTALIPIHGAVQLASNLTRVTLLVKHASRPLITQFTLGTLIGSLVGSQVVVALPENIFSFIIGAFTLAVTWLPPLPGGKRFRGKWLLIGSGISFLTLFIGAVGPLLAPLILREKLTKYEIIATTAGCQAIQHLAKVLVFGAVGFDYLVHARLLILMIAAVFVGTYFGKILLGKIPEEKFRAVVKALISILAARMIWISFIT